MKDLNCLIDLHLHLDGAISMDSARKLAALQNISIPEDDDELRTMMTVDPDCKDLNQFLEKFAFPCSLIQTPEGTEMAVYNLCSELKGQGVMYAEIRYAPQLCTEKGMTQRESVEAALRGIEKSGLPAQLILCCMRLADNYEANIETVNVAKQFFGKGVCLLDLAGAEALFPTESFADVFQYAKGLGIPFTIHAGEAAGPGSVKAALDLGACRIGHGVRSIEDADVMRRLIDSKIPLELCPTSNLQTCIYNDLSEYPIRKLMDAGVIVTVNTDDLAIEGTALKNEIEMLIDEFDLSDAEVKELLLNSVNASRADEDLKAKMRAKIESEL